MNHAQHRPADPATDPALIAFAGLIVGMLGVHWLGADFAAFVTHRRWPISVSDSVIALASLPRHPGEPRLAFPASIRADLAGPVAYWTSVATVLAIVLFLAVAIGSKVAGTRTEAVNRRRRLGVPTQPALATTKDLAPLFVRRPVPDRLVLLPHRRGWLSTESSTATKPRGIQGAVALFGASQSGKTTALVSSITHWSARRLSAL